MYSTVFKIAHYFFMTLDNRILNVEKFTSCTMPRLQMFEYINDLWGTVQ